MRVRLWQTTGITGAVVGLAVAMTVVNIFLDTELLGFVADTFGRLAGLSAWQKFWIFLYALKALVLLWAIIFWLAWVAGALVTKYRWPVPSWLLVGGFVVLAGWRAAVIEPALFRTFYSHSPLFQGAFDSLLRLHVAPILSLLLPVALTLATWLVLSWRARLLILSLLIVLVGLRPVTALVAKRSSDQAAPTILFIVVDSLRRDYAEGNPASTLGKFAASSVVLEKMYTPNPASAPAAAAILSGQYPYQSRANFLFLDRQLDRSLFTKLRNDYGIYLVTDFADDEIVNRQNFSLPFSGTFAPRIDNDTHVIAYLLQRNVVLISLVPPSLRHWLIPELYQTEISDSPELLWQTRQLLAKKRDEKKIVLLTLSNLHIPLEARYPYYRIFLPQRATAQFAWDWRYPDYTYRGTSAAANRNIRALYEQNLAALNDQLGNFFDQLRAYRLTDNLTIVLTADHGESLFDQDLDRYSHNNLESQHVLNVPFFVQQPGLPPRRDAEHMYLLNDALQIALQPAQAASYARPVVYLENDIDFKNLDSQLWQGVYNLRSYQRMEITDLERWHRYKKRAVIADGYQLTYDPEGPAPYALFNVAADPLHQRDLALQQPERVAQLRALLAGFSEESRRW